MQMASAERDAEIRDLKARLEAGETARTLAVTQAVGALEKELRETAAVKRGGNPGTEGPAQCAGEVEQKLAVTTAVSAMEKERDELRNGLRQAELEKQLSEKSLKDKYETQIRDRDDAIERLKDMKVTPVHQDGGGDPGAALRDRVQPYPGYRLSPGLL